MKYLWTTIHVKNMDESILFYSDLLGLQVMQASSCYSKIKPLYMFLQGHIEGQKPTLAKDSKRQI